MPKVTVTTCSVCGRYPPAVESVTSYDIHRAGDKPLTVDLCNEDEEKLFELFPALRPKPARHIAHMEDRGLVDPKSLPPPPAAPARRRRRPGEAGGVPA